MSRRGKDQGDSKSTLTKLKLLIFAKQDIAVFLDNLKSSFNCSTITLLLKFQSLHDPTPYLYPSNSCSTDDTSDVDVFSNFSDNIPFVSKYITLIPTT